VLVLGAAAVVADTGTELAIPVTWVVVPDTALVTAADPLGEDVVAAVGAGAAGVAAGVLTVSTVEATESDRLAVVD
jgi:hypothetical protein